MKNRFITCIILPLVLISACYKVGVEKPEGFAEIKTCESYYGVSPEGVLYRVRYVKNYPVKEIGFWQEAVKIHLEREGYELIDQTEFDAGGRKGVFFEWGAPYGQENYIYMTAIAVFGKRIAIAEAAGELDLYHKYRQALVASLGTITLK
ncbi:MAG: hypothetical protein JXB88_08660 [Spirochaetales bacterium]|nr:hypothetical protein [Spirochaetales bacterium]